MTTAGSWRIDRKISLVHRNPIFCAETLHCVPARYYVLVLYRHLATGPALAALLAIEEPYLFKSQQRHPVWFDETKHLYSREVRKALPTEVQPQHTVRDSA